MSQLGCLLYFNLLFVFCESSSLSFLRLLIVAYVLLVLSCLSSPTSSSLASFLLLCVGLVTGIFFSTKSLLVFFISYEFSLFPLSVLILIFGYQPEKLSATLYFLSYTLICGFPLFYHVGRIGGSVTGLGTSCRSVLVFLIGISFIVKSPIYVLHA
jgi:NADH:ubiquinone oxidoreductase subunit 4 (subunit M)